jgi:hypothetical protein
MDSSGSYQFFLQILQFRANAKTVGGTKLGIFLPRRLKFEASQHCDNASELDFWRYLVRIMTGDVLSPLKLFTIYLTSFSRMAG